MVCRKCKKELLQNSQYCNFCGAKQSAPNHSVKKRGNGQGSVYKESGGWTAEVTLGFVEQENGSLLKKHLRKRGFKTKLDAINYLPHLIASPQKTDKSITFAKMSALALEEHEKNNITKSTINNYKAAAKYFSHVAFFRFNEIGIDDLQECIDACPQGRRTKENMKAFCGLMYKFAIPRGYLDNNTNLATFLRISGESGSEKAPFSTQELDIIKSNIGKVPYADYIYAMCYLGFRPSEFLSLTTKDYNSSDKAFIGGAKTDAGKNRTVTVSPKIQPIIDALISSTKDGYVFHKDGKKMSPKTFREQCFYPALEQMKIPNTNPKRTPHSCRHTFANLLKNIQASDKDKMSLIGHSSEEMLRYYQSATLEDLRSITNKI